MRIIDLDSKKRTISIFLFAFSLITLVLFFIFPSLSYNFILLILSGSSFILLLILLIITIRLKIQDKTLFNEVYKFISPLKERYNGEIHFNKGEFPYYFKKLKRKNSLFVSFEKKTDDSVIMRISITHHHNFNLRFTHDIAYNMLGEKLFEGYASRYEEDSIERKIRHKIKGHKNISRYLTDKNRLEIIERLLYANFEIEFDYFNINLILDPVNIKDNYYLFRGVEAIIELTGSDILIMEDIPVIKENIARQINPSNTNKALFLKDKTTEKTEEEIIFYGSVIRLISMINDKRMFEGKNLNNSYKINFNVPPSTNNTYLMTVLKREIYNNFTGKYIPIGSIVKAFIKYNYKDSATNTQNKNHIINILSAKGRININDNKCGLSLKELLLSLLTPFYAGSNINYNKYKLYTPFVSLFRYAFTDPENFRFAFNTSDEKNCYELVLYTKGTKIKDIYVIVKKFPKRNVGSVVKFRWDMLYPLNIRKYIKHKFINSTCKDFKIIVDGHDLSTDKFGIKSSKTKSTTKEKNNTNKFMINLNSDREKRRLKLYSGGVLIRQLNDTPWDIKIDLPDSVPLLKDLSDFKNSSVYNSFIVSFFDYLTVNLIKNKVGLNEIINGITYLCYQLIYEKNIIKPVLKKIKTKLFPEKKYYCHINRFEQLRAFFGEEVSKTILPIQNKETASLWLLVLENEEKLFNDELKITDLVKKKSELKNNQYFNKLGEEYKKIIMYYFNKSSFKGKIYIVSKANNSISAFCSLNNNSYFNIDSSILNNDPRDPIFKYNIITFLLKSCGLGEKEIEREVMLC